MTVSGPPKGHEQRRFFVCTESVGGPLGDVSWAVLEGILTLVALDLNNDPGNDGAGPIAVFGTLTALHAASAIYGFTTVSECRAAQEDMMARGVVADDATEARIAELERQLRLGAGNAACTSDAECRADRVCDQGRCVSVPEPPSAPTTPPVLIDLTAPPTGSTPTPDAAPNPAPVRPESIENTLRPTQPSLPSLGQP